MRKICIVAHLNDLSGANRSLVDLADLLRKYYSITVVVPRKGDLYFELTKRGINCRSIFSGTWVYKKNEKSTKKIVKRFVNAIAEIRFYRFFKKEQFDLVHYNSSVYGCGAKAANRLGIKYSWHFRELPETNFQLTYFNRDASLQIIRGASCIITISDFMKSQICKEFPEQTIYVVYNGIKVASEAINNEQIKPEDLVIVGAVASDKCQADAIQAVKYLCERDMFDGKLYIVGAVTDDEYYNRLQNIITDDIVNSIVFVGYLSDVAEYRSGKYIALMCSKAEAFGRVTIEAMNSGQIVIGSNSGATSEIITDGEDGFLYTNGDYVDLANKIHMVLNLENPVRIMRKAKHKVATNFDISCTVEGVSEVFEQLLE